MREIVNFFGGQRQLADVLGISQQAVSRAVKRGRCPAHWVLRIANASRGEITPTMLRPDLYPEQLHLVRPGQEAA